MSFKRHSGHRLIPLNNSNLLKKRHIIKKRELESIRHRVLEREDRQQYSFMMITITKDSLLQTSETLPDG